MVSDKQFNFPHEETHWMTHHKLVKTTPNPSATKNKSGELVGPPWLLLLPPFWFAVGVGECEVVVVAIVALASAGSM